MLMMMMTTMLLTLTSVVMGTFYDAPSSICIDIYLLYWPASLSAKPSGSILCRKHEDTHPPCWLALDVAYDVHLFICSFVCLLVCLSVCWFVCLFVFLLPGLFACLLLLIYLPLLLSTFASSIIIYPYVFYWVIDPAIHLPYLFVYCNSSRFAYLHPLPSLWKIRLARTESSPFGAL